MSRLRFVQGPDGDTAGTISGSFYRFQELGVSTIAAPLNSLIGVFIGSGVPNSPPGAGIEFSGDALATNGIDVATGLAAARAIDRGFDPATSVRAPQFYGDGTLNRVPDKMRQDLTRWAQEIDLAKLPPLHGREEISQGGFER